MWLTIKKLIKDCTTEKDGKTFCPFRVGGFFLSASSFPTFIGLAVFAVVKDPSHHFEMVAFGTSFCAMMSGLAMLAGGVAFKGRGEQQRDGDSQ